MAGIARSPKQIGALIQRARRLAHLSQTDISKIAGLWQETISKIENGANSTRLDTLCSLLAALDLELVIRPRTKGTLNNIEDIF